MPVSKKAPKEKQTETTSEFVERINKQEEKRNGHKIRFGFTKRNR